MTVSSMLWRRLDAPGHDACRLVQLASGWRLEGTAAFHHEGAAACIAYRVECDRQWRTRGGAVAGWIGERPVDIRVERGASGVWQLDGQAAGLDECVDLDLGFTPATNLFQLRRAGLVVGQAAGMSVAWLDVPDGGLSELRQRYERRDAYCYRYEAPRFGYEGMLRVGASGFVLAYPGLWEAEAGA